MFFMTKKMTKMYYSFFYELSINLTFFLIFQTIFVFQEDIKIFSASKELAFVSVLNLMTIFYLIVVKLRKNYEHYSFETINFFLFSANTMNLFSLVLFFLDKYALQAIGIINFYYINLFLISVLFFYFCMFKYNRLENYLESSMSDVMLKNAAYKKLKIDAKALATNGIKLPKKMIDKDVISHEIGHLMFILPFINENNEVMVSIIPDYGSKGFVLTNILKDPQTKKETENKMLFLVGGIAAGHYENMKSNREVYFGAKNDLWKFSNLAASYLESGFSKKMQFMNESSTLTMDYINFHNKQCLDYLYKEVLKNALIYLSENNQVFEELKSLLEKEKVLYTDDLLQYKSKLKGEIKCDL